MSNTNPPPEQVPSVSAADLRARLLASTPPPVAATTATLPTEEGAPLADEVDAEAESNADPQTLSGSAQELLARLKMPGKSGPVPVPVSRSTPSSVPVATDPLPRAPATRRPTPNGSIGNAVNQIPDYPSGSGRYAAYDESPMADVQRLRSENKELRTLLSEMKHLLQEASDFEQRLVAKEKEFEEMKAKKDAQIEELSAQLGSIEEQISKGELAPPPPKPKTRSELEEWNDELERENVKLQKERKRMDQERQQLREDEEALEQQMKDMELAMARERALIARQETELRRLSAEIQHELEMMQRGDASLRDQMAKFQRRAQEAVTKPGGR